MKYYYRKDINELSKDGDLKEIMKNVIQKKIIIKCDDLDNYKRICYLMGKLDLYIYSCNSDDLTICVTSECMKIISIFQWYHNSYAIELNDLIGKCKNISDGDEYDDLIESE